MFIAITAELAGLNSHSQRWLKSNPWGEPNPWTKISMVFAYLVLHVFVIRPLSVHAMNHQTLGSKGA